MPELFQEKLDRAIEGLEGIFAIFNYILIIGEGDTMEEAEKVHDERLINLFERARVRKLKLHPEKIKFKLKTVPWVGHKLTNEGLQADESKVTAIKQFPAPTNVHVVRRFLGMVNFFSRFVPNLSAILEPLHDITKKDNINS